MFTLAIFVLLLHWWCVFIQAAEETPTKNVLYIVVDDLRTELPFYAQNYVHAPNLDALQEGSYLIEHMLK